MANLNGSCSGSPKRLQSTARTGLPSSQGGSPGAEESISDVTYLYDHRQDASAPHHMGLIIGLCDCPQAREANFPQRESTEVDTIFRT